MGKIETVELRPTTHFNFSHRSSLQSRTPTQNRTASTKNTLIPKTKTQNLQKTIRPIIKKPSRSDARLVTPDDDAHAITRLCFWPRPLSRLSRRRHTIATRKAPRYIVINVDVEGCLCRRFGCQPARARGIGKREGCPLLDANTTARSRKC